MPPPLLPRSTYDMRAERPSRSMKLVLHLLQNESQVHVLLELLEDCRWCRNNPGGLRLFVDSRRTRSRLQSQVGVSKKQDSFHQKESAAAKVERPSPSEGRAAHGQTQGRGRKKRMSETYMRNRSLNAASRPRQDGYETKRIFPSSREARGGKALILKKKNCEKS